MRTSAAALPSKRMPSFANPNVNPSFWSISVTRTSSDSESERRLASSSPPKPAPRMTTCFMRRKPYAPRRGGRAVAGRGGDSRAAPPKPRSVSRRDRSEEAVSLVVDAGGEEQGLRVAVRAGVAELERPEPVDRELAVRRDVERAAVLEVAVRHLLVCVDLPVAEVADQQVAAEAAERRRCPGETPRCAELPVLSHPAEELPVEVVDVDNAEAAAV